MNFLVLRFLDLKSSPLAVGQRRGPEDRGEGGEWMQARVPPGYSAGAGCLVEALGRGQRVSRGGGDGAGCYILTQGIEQMLGGIKEFTQRKVMEASAE